MPHNTSAKDPAFPIVSSGAATPTGQEDVNEIRRKIDALYNHEPNAEVELRGALEPGQHSPHQQFMLGLHKSGKTAEEIQTAWHSYYQQLSHDEKFAVWQEFYAQQHSPKHPQQQDPKPAVPTWQGNQPIVAEPLPIEQIQLAQTKSHTRLKDPARPRNTLPNKLNRAKLAKFRQTIRSSRPKGESLAVYNKSPRRGSGLKGLMHSVGFGLSIGFIFLLVYMFTFFNQRFITPFIKPSSIASATQIITVPNAQVSAEPRIIIPKLNVEAPVVYGVPFIQPGESPENFEKRTQTALEDGVVHYPTSQRPGEAGSGFNSNVVIVGHSSGNLFNAGKYKFAFMQIRQLENDDTFSINYESKQYVYRVYDKKVVSPDTVSILGPAPRPNSATLITCDPPGLNTNRMVVFAEQISPDTAKNIPANTNRATAITTDVGVVPGNSPSLWSRILGIFDW